MAQIAQALPAMKVASTVLATVAPLYAGQQEQKSAYDEAQQLLQRARLRRAEATRAYTEELRQGRLTKSRAIALAAASGGGVDDPTVQNVISNLDTDARYRALMALYSGAGDALGLENAARKRMSEGRASARAGLLGAAKNALTGYVGFKSKYA